MTWNPLSGIFVTRGNRAENYAKLNASRLVRDSQGRLRPRLGARAVRCGGRGRVRLQRGAARTSGPGLPARVAHPAQGPRRARAGLRSALRAGAIAARVAEHRPAGLAARAGIQRSTSRAAARGRARPAGRGQHRHFRIQSPVAVGWGARARLGAAAGSLVREVHRPAAAQGLARAARLRADRRSLRLLRPAVLPAAVARALQLHGEGGRPLVADLRRRLRRSSDQAQCGRAPSHAGMARQTRRQKSAGSGDAEAKRTACRKARAALTSCAFTRTVPARATRVPADGGRGSKWVRTRRNFSAAKSIHTTIAWSLRRWVWGQGWRM